MDPQSSAFTPRDDIWRLSSTVRSVQEIQQEHSDRLLRLERRQDEETRMKSVWGPTSPFPGILSGTPQPGSVNQFDNFDDEQPANMVRSLHLDTEDEPRRLGTTSRANSVRFDESANQSQWAHGHRASVDILHRTPSVLSGLGHPMFERSTSHKSDGKQSSASQSAVSRANSLGVDTLHPFGPASLEPRFLPPALSILGPVPAIIRCWLNTDFKHESLLYAAVCTGSYKSFLDIHQIETLGFADQITHDPNGDRKIKLPVYLPEATPIQPMSSRSNSPAPQLPSLLVDFTVVFPNPEQTPSKVVQIFLGSDVLQAHNADVLFSSRSLTLFDSSRSKLSVPLVRPESSDTFKSLCISNVLVPMQGIKLSSDDLKPEPSSEALGRFNGPNNTKQQNLELRPISLSTKEEPVRQTDYFNANSDDSQMTRESSPDDHDLNPLSQKTTPGYVNAQSSVPDNTKESTDPSIALRISPPAIWSNWRNNSTVLGQNGQNDYANASKAYNSSAHTRPNRESGMMVLKPVRALSRTAVASSSSSPVTNMGHSRYFEEARRRSVPGGSPLDMNESGDSKGAEGKENVSLSSSISSGGKSRTVNPIGGGSAFSWLNSSQGK